MLLYLPGQSLVGELVKVFDDRERTVSLNWVPMMSTLVAGNIDGISKLDKIGMGFNSDNSIECDKVSKVC